ncbi:MAG: glycosyltransferase family 2 protein [Acidobacteria bacterium]|nr:glycosyltransferase family 2 protein [Acidobacteriota bacterium]
MSCYFVRHLLFALYRLFGPHKVNYMDLAGFHLPSVSVLLPMHNEEEVAPDVLEALLETCYPRRSGRFEIIPINDHSSDGTGQILDEYARRHPQIKPLHRAGGARGKPAALKEASNLAQGEVLVVFDADYIPGKSLLEFLVAPFADPQVGAVMGRVVPYNVGDSLLTRLLDLERAAGYQVNQQARYDLDLIAQYGGTAGAVRRTALDSVGGWNPTSLTEDTDLTLRLAIRGWKVVYLNRAECYEEVPATWRARRRQIGRWAIGHTDCFHRYGLALLRSPWLGWKAKLDGILLLGVYLTAPLIVLGWLASVILFFRGESYLPTLVIFFLAATCCNTLGNFAAFLEIGSSAILDGARQRIRLLPLNITNFVFSTATVSLALARYYARRILGRSLTWEKTQRYRNGNGNGGPNGNGDANGRGLNAVRTRAAAQGSSGSS